MRVKMLAALVILTAAALPAQARASTFAGIVIAKQPQRGTLVLASASGAGLTIQAASGARIGDRVALHGARLRDGTIASRQLKVLSHVREARIRGVVVRQRTGSTLLATGHSVITIHSRATRRTASGSDDDLRPGTPAEFTIRFDGEELVEEDVVALQGQPGNVEIEGVVVSVSPLVVSTEELPITITVPAGMTLPAALAPGRRVELIVQVGAGNVFTLATVKEIENARRRRPRGEGEGRGRQLDRDADRRLERRLDLHVCRSGRGDPADPGGRHSRRGPGAGRSTGCSPSSGSRSRQGDDSGDGGPRRGRGPTSPACCSRSWPAAPRARPGPPTLDGSDPRASFSGVAAIGLARPRGCVPLGGSRRVGAAGPGAPVPPGRLRQGRARLEHALETREGGRQGVAADDLERQGEARRHSAGLGTDLPGRRADGHLPPDRLAARSARTRTVSSSSTRGSARACPARW